MFLITSQHAPTQIHMTSYIHAHTCTLLCPVASAVDNNQNPGVLEKMPQKDTASESKDKLYLRKKSKLQSRTQYGHNFVNKNALQKDRKETCQNGNSDYIPVLGLQVTWFPRASEFRLVLFPMDTDWLHPWQPPTQQHLISSFMCPPNFLLHP